MKRLAILLTALAIMAGLSSAAFAQGKQQLCFPSSGTATNCVPVTPQNPYPVTATISGSGIPITGTITAAQGSPPWSFNLAQAAGVPVVAGTAPIPVGFYNPSGGALLDPTLPSQVVGSVASGVADTGNPVKTGGKYNATLPTFADGQRGDAQLDTAGNTRVYANGITGGGADGTSNTLVFIGNRLNQGGSGLLGTANYNFNGSTWDRQFSCPNSAVVNVTGGNTTELVALTALQTIRVCSFALTMSLAGTAQFLYGTGTNCASSPINLTGAMTLGTTTPMAVSAGNGSLFRGAVANAICLAAVTGNVTGFITYAKY